MTLDICPAVSLTAATWQRRVRLPEASSALFQVSERRSWAYAAVTLSERFSNTMVGALAQIAEYPLEIKLG